MTIDYTDPDRYPQSAGCRPRVVEGNVRDDIGMRLTGGQAEERACRYLKDLGYQIVARNWRCRFGEIDIVAREGDTLVFVEVKARSTGGFGGPEGAVDRRKQGRLVAAARCFISKTGAELPVRFDVVTFLGGSVRLYRDAFRVD